MINQPRSAARSRKSVAGIAAILVLLAFATFSSSCKKAVSGDSLIVISPHPETLLYEFEWAFQPWYRHRTGRDVRIVYLDQGGTSKMLRFIFSEFERSPESADIDLVWGGGIENYIEMAGKGLLHPHRLSTPTLQAIPPEYFGLKLYDPQFRWYATSLTGFGIVYNRRVLKLQNLRTPRTWTDLADPAFLSWVGSADPRQSGSAHMVYEIILQAHGWEKGWEIITPIGANIKAFSRLASGVPKDAALGEIACGLCIDSYAYAQMAFSGPDVLGYVMPEGLTVVNPEGIGILKGAPHLDVAETFLDFVMSDAGQRLLMMPIGKEGGPRQFRISRMSVLPSLYGRLGGESLVRVNPFKMKSALTLDLARSSARWKLLNDLFGVLIVENHDLLSEAWKAVNACDPTRRGALVKRLGEMPLTEDEALRLATQVWKNPLARNKVILDWSRFARKKYGSVLREARRADLASAKSAQ